MPGAHGDGAESDALRIFEARPELIFVPSPAGRSFVLASNAAGMPSLGCDSIKSNTLGCFRDHLAAAIIPPAKDVVGVASNRAGMRMARDNGVKGDTFGRLGDLPEFIIPPAANLVIVAAKRAGVTAPHDNGLKTRACWFFRYVAAPITAPADKLLCFAMNHTGLACVNRAVGRDGAEGGVINGRAAARVTGFMIAPAHELAIVTAKGAAKVLTRGDRRKGGARRYCGYLAGTVAAPAKDLVGVAAYPATVYRPGCNGVKRDLFGRIGYDAELLIAPTDHLLGVASNGAGVEITRGERRESSLLGDVGLLTISIFTPAEHFFSIAANGAAMKSPRCDGLEGAPPWALSRPDLCRSPPNRRHFLYRCESRRYAYRPPRSL